MTSMNLTKIHLLWLVVFMVLAYPEEPVSAVHPELLEPDNNRPQCIGTSRGTNFVLGFSDNYLGSEPSELTVLVVAFSDEQTLVTISSKFQVDGKPFQETFVLEAGGFIRTILPSELVMEANGRSFKGIEVTASSEVAAYGLMLQNYTTDGFLAIPTSKLGMQYVVVMSTPVGILRGQFSVIGTEDSTMVQIVLRGRVTFDGQTYVDGDVLSFMVDKLEAVHLQGDVLEDLTGTIVQTNRPVAIFSGNECVSNPGSNCDTLTEQLVPVKSWGENHIYTAARNTDSNSYRIVAYFTDTIVTIPGFGNQSLGAGEFWEGSLSGSGLVSSTKPTLMTQQLVHVNGELVNPSLIQVPSVEHFDYEFGFTTPPYSGEDRDGFFNFINIIVKKNSRQNVYLNGFPINGPNVTESDVHGTDYTSLTVQLPKGEGVYHVKQIDLQSSPLSVIVYGYEIRESYGYAAGLSLTSNEEFLSLTSYYLRELGGEVFITTVPCLESNEVSYPGAQCKFSTGFGDVVVPGERTDAYTVICITPTFYKNGLISVGVSLDEGNSFHYSGIVYVASEEDLLPSLTVQQVNSKYGDDIVNLTSDDPIMLSWDPRSLGKDVSRVTLMGQDADYNIEGNPVLMEGVVLKDDVLNNGSLTINPNQLQSFSNDGLSLSAFYLTPSSARQRRDIGGPLLRRLRIYSPIVFIATAITCEVSKYQLRNTQPMGLPSCPCNNGQAGNDANFQEANFANFFFHPGADVCYRSVNSLPSGAASTLT
ncbi:uncharacterized protein LOC110978791 [Acanthaster planci]|uniref:Uncharacterized protein LOC110978791 n=1 Tax=Acanthaster planci TaxID=133434 RepID=A0A8B7YDN7_ACAPL|nr:uncharacterized protein LOC110978791 [Acanthaster planci]